VKLVKGYRLATVLEERCDNVPVGLKVFVTGLVLLVFVLPTLLRAFPLCCSLVFSEVNLLFIENLVETS
jgi:hypothetical protein